MADESTLIFNILVGRNDAINTFNQIEKSITNLGKLSAQGFDVDSETQGMKNLATQVGLTEKQINSMFESGEKRARGFDFSFLGLLFTGMALQRTFGSIFRMMDQTFSKIGDTSLESTRQFGMFNAELEFLKFRLFDVVAGSDAFASFVGTLGSAIERVSDMLSENEQIGDLIFKISTIGFAIGTGLVTAGILSQLGNLMISTFPGIFGFGPVATGGFAIVLGVGLAMLINDFQFLGTTINEKGIGTAVEDLLGDIFVISGGVIGLFFSPGLGALVVTLGLVIKFRTPIIEAWEGIKQWKESFWDNLGLSGVGDFMTGVEEKTRLVQPGGFAISLIEGLDDAESSMNSFQEWVVGLKKDFTDFGDDSKLAVDEKINPALVSSQEEVKTLNSDVKDLQDTLEDLTGKTYIIDIVKRITTEGGSDELTTSTTD